MRQSDRQTFACELPQVHTMWSRYLADSWCPLWQTNAQPALSERQDTVILKCDYLRRCRPVGRRCRSHSDKSPAASRRLGASGALACRHQFYTMSVRPEMTLGAECVRVSNCAKNLLHGISCLGIGVGVREHDFEAREDGRVYDSLRMVNRTVVIIGHTASAFGELQRD